MKKLLCSTLLAIACDRAPSPPPPVTSAAPAPPPPASSSAAPAASAKVGAFDNDPVGAPSSEFEAVVGDWYVAKTDTGQGLKVDGSRWREGAPSTSLADQARRLYGDRYAEFLDGVKAFAFFPLAVWKKDPPGGDMRISVRFYPEAGKIDQAAGIAFAIAPDGSYLGVRANALEDNVLFFRVVKGKRSIVDTIRDTPTPTRAWHTLAVEIRGAKIVTELDGQKRHEKTLEAPPRGRVGLWSKADSQVVFDDFEVRSL
jgi:hypothetical protein